LLPRFSYLVLNSATHWHKASVFGPAESIDEMIHAYEKTINIVLDIVQQHQQLTTYIRSTPYGHGNCSQYHEPSVTPNAPDGTKPWEYEWHLFPKLNALWKVSDGAVASSKSTPSIWDY
jgi:DNA polymerase phi